LTWSLVIESVPALGVGSSIIFERRSISLPGPASAILRPPAHRYSLVILVNLARFPGMLTKPSGVRGPSADAANRSHGVRASVGHLEIVYQTNPLLSPAKSCGIAGPAGFPSGPAAKLPSTA